MSNKYDLPFEINRAVIEINGGCNYSCTMCPQTTGRGKDWLKKISLADFERIIEQCVEAGVEVVNLEGSGEPTLNSDLHEYIKLVDRYGAKPFIYTNGFNLSGDLMKRCVDAGLYLARFSVIGYDKEQYKKWMNRDAFDVIIKNVMDMQDYITTTRSKTIVASYHLILDNQNVAFEIEKYKKNFIHKTQTFAEIWKMHNWSGVYDSQYKRTGNKRTCGRPFSPDITIRAGGPNNTKLTVAPCCQTLGRDSQANLGSVENASIKEVWNGEQYRWLRQMHAEKKFDQVPFCKDCDFLLEDNEVLVYKNNNLVDINKMKGTSFNLQDYMYEA